MEYDIFDYKLKLYDAFGRDLTENMRYRFRNGPGIGLGHTGRKIGGGGGDRLPETDNWTPDKGNLNPDSIDKLLKVNTESQKRPHLLSGGDDQLLFIRRLHQTN